MVQKYFHIFRFKHLTTVNLQHIRVTIKEIPILLFGCMAGCET